MAAAADHEWPALGFVRRASALPERIADILAAINGSET
jgi:hypothetical protein